jgi:hypothetical protein
VSRLIDYMAIAEEWGGRFAALKAPETPRDHVHGVIVRSIQGDDDEIVCLVCSEPAEDGREWRILIRKDELAWVLKHPVKEEEAR